MTLEQFVAELAEVKPGQYARVPYDVFKLLFPPGKEDDGAKEVAYQSRNPTAVELKAKKPTARLGSSRISRQAEPHSRLDGFTLKARPHMLRHARYTEMAPARFKDFWRD